MNLSEAKKELKELTNAMLQKQASNYSCIRTKKGYLKIFFENGRRYKFPCLKLRGYQLSINYKLFIECVKRFFLVWARRAGKEVITWNIIIQAALEKPGAYMMIYPTAARARIVLWEGSITLIDTGESLKFLDMIPPELVLKKNDSTMTIHLVNGSVVRVAGSDMNINKFRGINLEGAVYAEFAFSDPRVRQVLDPVFRQNGGWYIIQTTFDGTNHAYSLYQSVKSDPLWHCEIQNVETLRDENGNRYITDEMVDEDRRQNMPEWFIQQEYFCVIQTNNEKYYFSNEVMHIQQEGKLIDVHPLANFPVYAFYDIGVRDSAAVVLVQFDSNRTPYIVGYIEDQNQGAGFYIREIDKFCARYYTRVACHYLPHDGKNRHFSHLDAAKSTEDVFHEAGEKAIVVPRPKHDIDGVNATRRVLYSCLWYRQNTQRLFDCISNYEKEYDEKLAIFKGNPLHNWASHGVKALQTFAIAVELQLINAIPSGLTYYS